MLSGVAGAALVHRIKDIQVDAYPYVDTQKVHEAVVVVTARSDRQEFVPLKTLMGEDDIVFVVAVAAPVYTPEVEAQEKLLVAQFSKAHCASTTPLVALVADSEHDWPPSVYTASATVIGL